MRVRWRDENVWTNPPVKLIGPAVQKILRQGATAALVNPVWPAQPWWPLAVSAC